MRVLRTLATGAFVFVLGGCGDSNPSPVRSSPAATPAALGSLQSSGAGHSFYEIYDPVGRPRGTMLVIHGGAWMDRRGDARSMMTVASLAFRANGWRVVDIGYSSGEQPGGSDPLPMLRDVVAFYDQARRAFGGPICAYGESAGGQLAAMLAIDRPSLTCAILNAAPLDLAMLVKHTVPAAVPETERTFGARTATLDEFSPALLWNRRIDRTAVFATAASNDQVVPPQQLTAFEAADPSADALVVPGAATGSPAAVPWMHSTVNAVAVEQRQAELWRWLDRIAPGRRVQGGPPAGDAGGGCDTASAGADRFKLMLSGDGWQQSSTAGQLMAATRGCSGTGRWQDDGISLWALPKTGASVPAGTDASLSLRTAPGVRRLTVSFRGFLARPQDWTLGLYASSHATGSALTRVASCKLGTCVGLRLVRTPAGALIAPHGYRGDPDASDRPPSATFTLPPGTRRLVWLLSCAAAPGCSASGTVGSGGASPRARDPLGQPAIFSIYKAVVR